MPKPQRIPEIPEDINLFEIPRKKAPGEPATMSNQVRNNATPPGGGGRDKNPPPPPTDQQAKYWEQKVKEHAAENLKLHQQLDSISKHRDQLLTVLSDQQQGGAVLEEAKAALEAEAVNARQLEQQLAHLQQRLHDLNSRAADKEQQLATSAAEISRLKAELEGQAAERGTLLADLREQLATTRESHERAELALRDQTAKAREATADLASLRLTHHELQRQCEEARKSTADLAKRNDDLEQRLTDRAGEVQHLRSELDRRGTSYADEFTLRTRLKEELRHEYNARLGAEQEVTARLRRETEESRARFVEVENAKRDLERRLTDLAGVEATLTKQLHLSQAAADKAQTSYGKEAARANKFEKTLETLKAAREDLQEKLTAERKESAKAKRRIEQLEERVIRSEDNLKRVKADLERQIAARKRLVDGGAEPTSDLSEMDARVRDSVSALARATADLEAERRRLESAALQTRMPSLDATRVGHAFVSSFRSQLRPSADNLMQSIRGLLEFSLEAEQKRLAEAALESALVIHTGLQDATSQNESVG